MNKRAVGYAIGKLLQVMGLILFLPMVLCLYYDVKQISLNVLFFPEFQGFGVGIVASLVLGSLLVTLCRSERENIGVKEGYTVVTLGWVVLSAVGSLPLFMYFLETLPGSGPGDTFRFFTDAFFETMSGFTTTGSTILLNIEGMPRGILFWRSLTHWLGGMGIITLALAIFPAMGVTGYSMYKGEVPGVSKERLQPRLSETAKILWGVYLLFTVVETGLLFAGGMPMYDSLCHTFGTLATGGFSTQNLSIGQYQNQYFHWVIVVFMLLSGINYMIHYRVILRRDIKILGKDSELHFYLATILVSIIFITGMLYLNPLPNAADSHAHFRPNKPDMAAFTDHVAAEQARTDTLYGAFTESSFQVVSIMTTTGYCTADFDVWPDSCRFLLVILMFIGGCAGSTGGGMKAVRILTVLKVSWQEIQKLARPRWIAPMKIGGQPTSERQVINVFSLFVLFLVLFVICTGIMTFFVPDLVTASTSVVATLCNIGPGLNGVGAIENYAWIPVPGKWVLSLCMLLGRLEIFSVLIVLRASNWRK